jgi:hypothetical protein
MTAKALHKGPDGTFNFLKKALLECTKCYTRALRECVYLHLSFLAPQAAENEVHQFKLGEVYLPKP